MLPLLILQSTSFILLLTLDPTESSFISHPSPPPLISDCLPVISLPLPHLTSFVNHPSSITPNLSPLTPPCTSSHSFISQSSLLPIPPSLPPHQLLLPHIPNPLYHHPSLFVTHNHHSHSPFLVINIIHPLMTSKVLND